MILMPHTTNHRTRIFYELLGNSDAPPLVLLRGLGRSRLFWGDLPPAFAEKFRVVLIDNRGVGESEVPSRPFSTTDMANDVAAVLDEVGIERAHLFGISLGGMIAQAFALTHPKRLDRLVLGCTSAGGLRSVRPKVGQFLAMARARVQSPKDAFRIEAGFVLSERFRAQHPEIIDEWVELGRKNPVPRRTMMLQLFAAGRHDAYARLPTIDAATLVIAPGADRLIPAENSHIIARRIPGAELACVKGAGHDFVTECPEETFEMVSRFLLSV